MRPAVSPDDGDPPGPRLRELVGVGGTAVGSIVLGTLVGLWLDNELGTMPILTLCGLALGILGAGYLSWRRIRAFLRAEDPPANWGPETYDDDDDDN